MNTKNTFERSSWLLFDVVDENGKKIESSIVRPQSISGLMRHSSDLSLTILFVDGIKLLVKYDYSELVDQLMICGCHPTNWQKYGHPLD